MKNFRESFTWFWFPLFVVPLIYMLNSKLTIGYKEMKDSFQKINILDRNWQKATHARSFQHHVTCILILTIRHKINLRWPYIKLFCNRHQVPFYLWWFEPIQTINYLKSQNDMNKIVVILLLTCTLTCINSY